MRVVHPSSAADSQDTGEPTTTTDDRKSAAVLEHGCHDLRAPLDDVLSATEALLSGLRGPLNDLQKKSVRMIDTSARRLVRAARDLEDYCAAIADRPRLRSESLVLAQVCEAVTYELEPAAEAKQISLEVHVHDREAVFDADEARTKEMLAHLLGRAIDRTAPGGRVLLASWIDESGVRFAVEHPARPRARRRDGEVDVALALAGRLARLHRGTVTAEDRDEGSAIMLTLPIA